MHHAAAMRFIERIRDLRTKFQDLVEGQRAFFESLRQGLALQAFHHQIVHTVLMAYVVQYADVRMIQAGDRFRFSFEALLANRIAKTIVRAES